VRRLDVRPEEVRPGDRRPPTADRRGIYDYVSNLAHPTAYAHIEMWTYAEDGSGEIRSTVSLDDHAMRTRLAVVPFYDALDCALRYNGWPRTRHEQLATVLKRVLPGVMGAEPEPPTG
jgi:hypothetical protein